MSFGVLKGIAMATAPPPSKTMGTLTMDKAAFLLIRIKRAFNKKRNKGNTAEKTTAKKKPPLLRALTLPAIINPSLSIIQAQLDSQVPCPQPEIEEKPPQRAKLSLPLTRSKKSPGASDKKRASQESIKWHLVAEDEESSMFSKSPSTSPRHSVSSTGSVSSQISTGKEHSKKNEYQSTRAGLAKLARLLTSKDSKSNDKTTHRHSGVIIPDIEITTLRKSGSMDSLLDFSGTNSHSLDNARGSESNLSTTCLYLTSTNQSSLETPSDNLLAPYDNRTISPSPSVPAKLESHRRIDFPPSPSISHRGRSFSGVRQGSVEMLVEGIPLSKAERKKLEKLNKINIDLQALFAAVEHEHVDRAKSILETTDVNVNCVNADGFTPLDIAVMTSNVNMVKLLQSYGAREGTLFRSKESRLSQLTSLLKEAEKCVGDLTTCVLSAATGGSLSIALLKEKERQLSIWKRRHQLVWTMKNGFEKIRIPDPPTSVQLEVVGSRSLKVKFSPPESANEPETIVTKYKVEWSCYEDFNPSAGSREVIDLQKLEVAIPDLTQGNTYYIRVAAGNSKGYSVYQRTSPLSAVPSSWRDVDGKKSRSCGRIYQLDGLFQQIIYSRPPHAAEVKGIDMLTTPQQQRRQVKKGIKHLFASTPKFQKTMKRGVFLACLLYNEDRVLVTSEDTLPLMEVDEAYPASLHTDFHWIMKVACTWEDVKSLRLEMEKSQSSSNVHFRSRLLQAAEQMQTALGIQDLGQLYYLPIKDTNDVIILCTVKYVNDPKGLNNISVRWLPISKLQRKLSIVGEYSEQPRNDLLLSSVQDMITYNQLSGIPLPRGLYLGYVKLKSSVDLIKVLVPRKAPNTLPYCRIRENPHISCEEWSWIKELGSEERTSVPTKAQLKLQRAISSAARNLLSLLDIPFEQIDLHRLYDVELIELTHDVSFILLLPPVENVCSIPGQCENVTSRSDCILLPIQIFEMIHMATYQPRFIMRYSRLSSILEMDTAVAHHAHREAFSTAELAYAKFRLGQLQDFQAQLDNTWRSVRWIMDVLTFARDKQVVGGVPLLNVWTQKADSPSPAPSPTNTPVRLQVPKEVTAPSRPEKNDKIFIKITNSSSSFSLNDSPEKKGGGGGGSEIRRCASTSGLVRVVVEDNMSNTGQRNRNEWGKSPSVDKMSVTFDLDTDDQNSISTTYGHTDNEEDVQDEMLENLEVSLAEPEVDEFDDENEEETNSADGIFMNPTGSLSSNEAIVFGENEEFENASIHSKDSACSAGDDVGFHLRELHSVSEEEEEIESDAEFFRGPTTSKSVPSLSSITSDYNNQPGILRVYAAYDSGLPSGTSVRLNVTPETSSRDIVETVVKQLNMAVVVKGKRKPIYSNKDLRHFCLVAAVGRRVRALSDDFQPLKVQNPWTKGKLFVKKKSDVMGSWEYER